MDNCIPSGILTKDERAVLHLRALYREHGYVQYRTSKFEEYSLYTEHKAFLPPGDIISFTGANGKLMALRPDVTLSIAKSSKGDDCEQKLYYNENVYRSDGSELKEQLQVGLECMGNIDVQSTGEVLMLAKRSLESLGGRSCLDISHMGFINGIFMNTRLSPQHKKNLLRCVGEKNVSELGKLCEEYGQSDEFCDRITSLTDIHGPIDDVIGKIRSISINDETDTALNELESICDILRQLDALQNINLDFAIVNDLSYYSGVIFHGYIEGIPRTVLSGGRYDMLMSKFGKRSGAIGFAVYLDLLNQRNTSQTTPETLNIALPKGRLGDKAYEIFEASGYGCPAILEKSRRLVFESPDCGVRYFWVKPSDVAIYVERGVADIGVVGKDILLEHSPDVYELLDLDIGKCRMCVAAKKGFTPDCENRLLTVATSFPNIARDHFEKQGRDIDIIKLNGAVELAPLLDLGDVIVDIVETGKTLLENDMEPIEDIVDISARLVANKVSHKFNHEAIKKLCDAIVRLAPL